MTIKNRTWRSIPSDKSQEIYNYILANGGEVNIIKNEHIEWQLKLADATFTYYKKGTLYCTGSKSNHPIVVKTYQFIDNLIGSSFVRPEEDIRFIIGFDEVGKGEFIGSLWLSMVIIPVDQFITIENIISTIDTKKRKKFETWKEIMKKLDNLKLNLNTNPRFDYLKKRIPPWEIDKYEINSLLDIYYSFMFQELIRLYNIDFASVRIEFDDYGIGDVLKQFLKFAESRGALIVYETKSEDRYLGTRVASIIAKYYRERELYNINLKFSLNKEERKLKVGTGAANDQASLYWLEEYYKIHNHLPWFVRKSFKPVINTLSKLGFEYKKYKKNIFTFDPSFISEKYRRAYEEGVLSLENLAVNCPYCSSELTTLDIEAYLIEVEGEKSKKLKDVKIVCPDCGKDLTDIATNALRAYCGFIVVDSNILGGKFLSRELSDDRKDVRIFEGFTIIIPTLVYIESAQIKSVKYEIDKLSEYNRKGRIKLRIEDDKIKKNKYFTVGENDRKKLVDEDVRETSEKYKAIVLSSDKGIISTFALRVKFKKK